MRLHGLADTFLASPKRLAVLRVLLRHPDKSWTGRELARESGVSPRWTIGTLRRLEAEGAVRAESLPPAVRWTLEPRHALLGLLRPALDVDANARDLMMKALKEIVKPLRPQVGVWFGSTAQGSERSNSDVDLILVVHSIARQREVEATLERAEPRFRARFGNRLSPIVITSREFRKGRNRGFLKNVLATGKQLVGETGRE